MTGDRLRPRPPRAERAAARATRAILFSAPAHFIPGIEERFNAFLPTVFEEIWHRDDLPDRSDVTVWICQTGQSFVIDDEVLERFPLLEVLVTTSTGNNHIDMSALERRGIPFFSLLDDRPGLEQIAASAEMTFLLLLDTLRHLNLCVEEVRTRRWRQNEDLMRGHELQGRRIGIVGFGRMGRRQRRYCEAFGAEVAYYDPYVEDSKTPGFNSLEELFDWAQGVIICCSLTDETRLMIGEDQLKRLGPGAVLVNGARGAIVDEHALARLLDERDDIYVATDVVSGEVRGQQYESPLFRHEGTPQLTIVPHIAGATIESQAKAAFISLGLVQRFYEKMDAT
jgi:phosphoglycerate dehydrogenase-like enzyme